MIDFDLTNWTTDDVILTAEINCTISEGIGLKRGLACLAGVKHGIKMRYAELSHAELSHAELSHAELNHADLNGADLNGADLNGAELNGAKGVIVLSGELNLGWSRLAWKYKNQFRLIAGCRHFTIKEAREHWGDNYNAGRAPEKLACAEALWTLAQVMWPGIQE